MKKYQIKIPKPSAKRLENNRRLLIEIINIFSRDQYFKPIPNNQEFFEFEWEQELIEKNEFLLDADYKTVFFVEFENATGTRKELIKVIPKEIS